MKSIFKYMSIFMLAWCFVNTVEASISNERSQKNPIFEKHRVDQIITNEQGVFLCIDGFWLGSQGMHATPDGIFVLENGEWIPLFEAIECDDYYVWQCRNCERWNPQGINKCMYCRNPR